MVGGSIKVLDWLLAGSPEIAARRQQLADNTAYFRRELKKEGLTVMGHDSCPIVPVYLGDAIKAKALSEKLMEKGIYAIAFSFPVVPRDQARIRFQLSAAHDAQQLETCVRAVVEGARELGLL